MSNINESLRVKPVFSSKTCGSTIEGHERRKWKDQAIDLKSMNTCRTVQIYVIKSFLIFTIHQEAC